jgi:hypothetical protein
VNERCGVVREQRQRASGVVVDRDLGEVHRWAVCRRSGPRPTAG